MAFEMLKDSQFLSLVLFIAAAFLFSAAEKRKTNGAP